MSSPTTARKPPILEAGPLEQAAELVEGFALPRSLAALDGLAAESPQSQRLAALDEAAAAADALADECRLIDEEISRYLELRAKD